ncbi:unnamed protein product, partial [Hymenolepis diminuta]
CGSKRWVKRRHNSNWPNCLFSRSLFCVATFDFINFLIYLAPDMFSASRHAQRLAGNFLDDVDEFQRASRAADRRAMSHFDDATTTTYYTRPRRSMSVSRVVTVPSEYYIERPRYRSISVEPRYTYSTSGITQPVTMVGSRYYTPSSKYYHYLPRYYAYDTYYPSYSYYYDYPVYNTSAYKYWPTVIPSNFSHYLPTTSFNTRNNTSSFDYTLPTSGLRASLPSWDIGYKPLSLNRWYSYSNLLDSSPLGYRYYRYY